MLVNPVRPRLVFVSPVFLFPNDAGGKIRSTNILRGLKGGTFDITLVSVATATETSRWASEISSVCDHFIAWEPAAPRHRWWRVLDLFDELPVNVVVDRTERGAATVDAAIRAADTSVVVFDFVHSAVLLPRNVKCASVCFTHNVEAEIFERHAAVARNPVRRWVWASQHRKMLRFERQSLASFTKVVAVSDRDAKFFRQTYDLHQAQAIPTGVDLEFFSWQAPPAVKDDSAPCVVFTGSMDWAANIDGVQFFLSQVWPLVLRERPDARFVVVGRSPPPHLVQLASTTVGVEFTGFVDDVRPYVHAAHVFVIPLLVGGGTRIKAFEAMAMGCPIVSTTIGTEGLGAQAEVHFLQRDGAVEMSRAVLTLLADAALRERLSSDARQLVAQRFGHQVAARAFERICQQAMAQHLQPSRARSAMPEGASDAA